MQNDLTYQLFKKAFDDYYEPLCRYAFTLVKNEAACEDIVQETFVRIWDKKKDLIGSEGLHFYLFRAVRNNSLSYIEQLRRQATGDLGSYDMADTSADQPAPTSSGKDYHTLLQEAIGSLPPKCREVFVLSRVSDLSYQQISETLDISIKTVENHMGKALRILRSYVRNKQAFLVTLALLFLY
ncbi:RNA polymerase sigma-70 factor [Paraflavitalea pollutisoli]|uniref:RNA polymerase sigma-70 factor n=1 Tax=Paraflavitalea pollutisoli TaxID=3034143 RepID=UPI0023ED2F25|nr:RNA polymerase sigma-70 factor [Paraflavitalea sp. H1-2-19X]